MEEKTIKEMAAQLARPSGEGATAMGETMNDVNAFITARSIEALAPDRAERIVEIGPGNGILSLPIIESLGRDGHYIGLELSDDMARQAEQNLGKIASARVDIHAGDCMLAPIDNSTADGLMAVNLLYFIDDISAFFATVATWLKPGGRAVFGMRSEQSLKGMPVARYGFNIRSADEITEQLNASGFSAVDTKYFDEGTSMFGDLEIPLDSLIIRARLA